MGSLERNGKLFVVLNDAADKVARANADQDVLLDILVMQIGRSNFGRNFDLKGLVSDVVLLNGAQALLISTRCTHNDFYHDTRCK